MNKTVYNLEISQNEISTVKMEDLTDHQFMSFNVKILTLLNLWLEDGEIDELKWRNWKTYYIYLFLSPNLIPLFLEIFFVFMEPEADISQILEVFIAQICCLGGIYMGICFLFNRKRIKNIVNGMKNFQRFSDLDLKKADEETSYYSKGFLYYTAIGSFIYVTAPLLTLKACEERKPQYMKDLGIPCGVIVRIHLPFKYNYTPLVQILGAHQVCCAIATSLIIVTITMLICGLLRHAVLQLKQLRGYILEVSNKRNEDIDSAVKFSIQYHHAIIKFIEEVNISFGSQLLVHVTMTSLIISILGFKILAEEDKFESTRYALHLAGWFVLLLLICLYGQYLMDESEGIAIAAYDTPWYNSPVVVQKDIKMVIIRSQKPLTLDAMNLGILSRATFLKVLSSAYSYFTLLINAKN